MSNPATSDPPIPNRADFPPPVPGPPVPGPPVPGRPGPADPPPGPRSSGRGSGWRNAIEWIVIIAAALLVALVIKTFLFQAFYIPSESMEPALKPGDRVLVNKLSYHFHDIHRGDIVVFKRPPSEASDPTIKDLIKRVVGLPGETIEARDGKVYINGRKLNEPYLNADSGVTNSLPVRVVPANQYFVLGDNRINSKDSRFIGPIPRSLIVGRAFVRVWPLSSLGFL